MFECVVIMNLDGMARNEMALDHKKINQLPRLDMMLQSALRARWLKMLARLLSLLRQCALINQHNSG
jgi:hypothetical protein